MSVNSITTEEKFIADLQGCIVTRNILDLDGVDELNRIID